MVGARIEAKKEKDNAVVKFVSDHPMYGFAICCFGAGFIIGLFDKVAVSVSFFVAGLFLAIIGGWYDRTDSKGN